MNRKMLLRLAVAVQMISVGFLLPANAADGCQPLHDSVMKRLSTSSHMYMTETAGYLKGGPRSSEMIYLNADMYIYVGGKWRKSPISKDDMIQQQKENWQNAKNTSCRVVRDESVNGVATTVYAIHSETDDDKQDGQVWLSKASGLPVKEELDLDVGGGTIGKSHKSIRYEYTNIKAPM